MSRAGLALLFGREVQAALFDFVQGRMTSLLDEVEDVQLRPLSVGLLWNLETWTNKVQSGALQPYAPVQAAVCKLAGELDESFAAIAPNSILQNINSFCL
jgi:hypothetical protein